jgi:hypothetical protein
MVDNQPKPKPVIFCIRLGKKVVGYRVFITGRLYVGYVGIILNVPGVIALDLWFLKWDKHYITK